MVGSTYQVQHRDPLRFWPEDDTVVVTVARDLLVHHKAPLEGDSVESLGSLGTHHVSPHSVQVNMFGVDSFPDGPVGSPVFAPSVAVGPEDVAQVAGQLHLLYEPAAVDLQLLEVFTITQTGSNRLKLLLTMFYLLTLLRGQRTYPGTGWTGGILLRLSSHVSGAVTPDQLDPAQDLPLVKFPVNMIIAARPGQTRPRVMTNLNQN